MDQPKLTRKQIAALAEALDPFDGTSDFVVTHGVEVAAEEVELIALALESEKTDPCAHRDSFTMALHGVACRLRMLARLANQPATAPNAEVT